MNNDRFLKFLGLTKRAGKLKEGYNKCEETLKLGYVKLIIMSLDASLNTKDKFNTYCKRYGTCMIEDFSKEELGKALGREEINLVCVTDDRMSKKLLELWNEKNNNRG
ncbi:Ribosomal protein L7Ae [Clostridium acidisoli DSM 12555]|jgi:ribosomal protein L7Ae-like RNA K-turn-binding protein|uniref:Ribosomal protein L7Ae n=1 Tax=Clostridium acidisoli DSM 12555 TaxID=1121291 RepID=A0A1W1XDW2_9CLOT|nr:ribosomal L7Ae/L30e/S12e/Gadd45 family protein [Clostridium acidisoli]SMC21691.1 Ribosomal protein L7Ae [Clostridium acidisoli DSM 12555]